MRRNFRIFSVFLLFITITLPSCNAEKTLVLRFKNSLKLDRINEVVALNLTSFTAEKGDLPVGSLPVFIDGTDTLTSQNIDLNKDGIPEEILVEISLKADSHKDIEVVYVLRENFPDFPMKTNLHFAFKNNPQTEIDSATRIQSADTKVTAKILQMEGPVWENDKVGFRNYYDLRNGMDIFGKISDKMVLDSIGLTSSYHVLSNWGMDILKVANSLGAGAIGVETNGKLYRIGDNGQSAFERIIEGPLKSEFAFYFTNWTAGTERINLIQYISITSGLYRFETEVFAELPDASYSLVTGIVNKHADSLVFKETGENHVFLSSFAKQAEDSANLGMAVLIPKNIYKSHESAPNAGEGITECYYARMKMNLEDPAHYYFYAGWETGNSVFGSLEGFLGTIEEDVLKLESPIQIQKLAIK